VLAELERLRTLMQQMGQQEAIKLIDKSLHDLRQRPQMMRYAHFQAQGYPIGSGRVESAHKLVVQSRMKQAGMRWEPGHAAALLAMRNLACNGRWQEGWLGIRQRWQQQRQAARALWAQAARAAQAVAAVPFVPPEEAWPLVSAVVQVLPAPSTVEPSTSSPRVPILPRGSREAGTHCWHRPFLRRRSA